VEDDQKYWEIVDAFEIQQIKLLKDLNIDDWGTLLDVLEHMKQPGNQLPQYVFQSIHTHENVPLETAIYLYQLIKYDIGASNMEYGLCILQYLGYMTRKKSCGLLHIDDCDLEYHNDNQNNDFLNNNDIGNDNNNSNNNNNNGNSNSNNKDNDY
jgi:hypothetical protein